MDGEADVPDAFYWAFEERMRGSSGAIRARLGAYESLARELLDRVTSEDGEPPRWLDLGCGRGEFCQLLREWGWDVEAVDRSPAAVEACRGLGIDVALDDALDYLERVERSPHAVSAIQLIEHVPRVRWPSLFGSILGVLRPGGVLLLETINGGNVRALADHFFADLTHTWPGHPETLRLLAEHVGFVDVDVRFEHHDAHGAAQDVVVWARKPTE